MAGDDTHFVTPKTGLSALHAMRARSGRASSAALFLAAVSCVGNAHAGGDRALGAHLATECATCHQASGRQTGGIPAITGLPADQFITLMGAYRSRQRDNQIMQTIARRLSDDEIAALAAHYESVK